MKILMTMMMAAFVSCAVMAQDKMNNTAAPAKAPAPALEAAPVNPATPATHPAPAGQPRQLASTRVHFWCTECDFSSMKEGVCPTHKGALVKEGMYFCKGDEANATAAEGKCKDGTAMVKMEKEQAMMKKRQEMMEKRKAEMQKANEQKANETKKAEEAKPAENK